LHAHADVHRCRRQQDGAHGDRARAARSEVERSSSRWPRKRTIIFRGQRMNLSELRAWLAARPRLVRGGAALAVFGALAILRTRNISTSFWLLGEQIRDWTIA